MARKERYLVALDVGTSTVACVVCESMDDGSVHVVGIGVAESRGIKRGVVVNLEAAVDSIKEAIEDAELMAGIEIDTVHLGTEKFIERVQSYIDLIPALRERVPEIDYVDLRFDERVYVRPSRGRRQRGT